MDSRRSIRLTGGFLQVIDWFKQVDRKEYQEKNREIQSRQEKVDCPP